MFKNKEKAEVLYIAVSICITLTVVIYFFGTNIQLTKKISEMKDYNLPIKNMGDFTGAKLASYTFEEKICPDFLPIEILSDKPDDPELASPGSCILTYKNEKHLLMKSSDPDPVLDIFQVLGKPYNKMSFQEAHRTVMEVTRPDLGWLILSQSEAAKAQIYLLGNFQTFKRYGKEIHKYKSGDKLIYRVSTSSFEKEWVIVIGKDERYECTGPYCLEYFQRINLI